MAELRIQCPGRLDFVVDQAITIKLCKRLKIDAGTKSVEVVVTGLVDLGAGAHVFIIGAEERMSCLQVNAVLDRWVGNA